MQARRGECRRVTRSPRSRRVPRSGGREQPISHREEASGEGGCAPPGQPESCAGLSQCCAAPLWNECLHLLILHEAILRPTAPPGAAGPMPSSDYQPLKKSLAPWTALSATFLTALPASLALLPMS